MKKIEVQINMEYICLKNNTAQLYFVLGRVDLDFIFFSLLRDAPDIHKFPTMYMANTHFLLENLWISVFLRYTGKIPMKSALPSIKYNRKAFQ